MSCWVMSTAYNPEKVRSSLPPRPADIPQGKQMHTLPVHFYIADSSRFHLE